LFYAGFVRNIVPSDLLAANGSKSTGVGFLREVAYGVIPMPDFIRILILAFAAGFAERFVPDTLDRLTGGRTPKKSDTNENT
jgi:hypothetical protein